jgi:hypothetical protein
MQREKIVEAMARAIREDSEGGARSDAEAALTALETLGLAVVPREPTPEMHDAGCDKMIDPIGLYDAYRAMLAAAPLPAAPNQRGV